MLTFLGPGFLQQAVPLLSQEAVQIVPFSGPQILSKSEERKVLVEILNLQSFWMRENNLTLILDTEH